MRGITWLLSVFLLLSMDLRAQSVSFLETEIKLNPRLEKIAGTLRVHARGDLTQRLWRVPQGLEIDRVTINEQTVLISRIPGGFELRENGPTNRLNRIEVVFYGQPAKQVATFSVDEEGLPWMRLEDTPDNFWHPVVPQSWSMPDSMWISVILPEKLRLAGQPISPRKSDWPGSSHKWTFSQPTARQIPPLNIGNYVRFTNLQRTSEGTTSWTYWVPASRLIAAQTHYAEAPAMISRFEQLWGPLPGDADRVWVEKPGRPALDRTIYDRTEPGYSQELLHHTASLWLGDPNLTATSSVREALYQYAELSWIEWKYPEPVFTRFLESYRTTPAFWGGWLLYYLSNDNSLRWNHILPDLLELSRNPTVTEAELRTWLSAEFNPAMSHIFAQFLDDQVLPLLETSLEKKRRRWIMSYRYAGVQPGFVWPIILEHRGKIIELNPTNEWQNFVWPKGGGKSYHIDESQGLFEIRSR